MNLFKQCMRWYGPDDVVSLSDIRQAGVTGVVTALHHIPNGEFWPREEIRKRKELIETAGLRWEVVESVPVHEAIKTHKRGFQTYIDNYKLSIEHLAAEGISTICYNFMPVLDWTRTDLAFQLDNGARALRFEKQALVAFDCFILKRTGAKASYSAEELRNGEAYFASLSEDDQNTLVKNIIAGLPGSEGGYGLAEFQTALDSYKGISAEDLALHLQYFLDEIIPIAEKNAVSMAIHPDDPPFPILGLPRVVSTAKDFSRILMNTPAKSNGITFCTGSLGARADNELLDMIREFGESIYFVHLRNVKRDGADFYEAEHLEGDVPMPEVMKAFIELQQQRGVSLPMRPDHGHQILDDLNKNANPGYTAIGRLKGLAELRGLEMGISGFKS
ncbi:mannonate dehydratase [Poritiphilus flavus]|uniref:Mannonate dehydratase n=1 Tax=Poritiphilus flavus TaxID=2697053 RepID=A0A6L9EGE9_9FLAO|nr:mannonate dehydratase [Poritiphilus flavus]NAS13824.1 mannonate dehydratase [Poritiphilus flavus]